MADRNSAIISVVFDFNCFSSFRPLSVAKDKIDKILRNFVKVVLVFKSIENFQIAENICLSKDNF